MTARRCSGNPLEGARLVRAGGGRTCPASMAEYARGSSRAAVRRTRRWKRVRRTHLASLARQCGRESFGGRDAVRVDGSRITTSLTPRARDRRPRRWRGAAWRSPCDRVQRSVHAGPWRTRCIVRDRLGFQVGDRPPPLRHAARSASVLLPERLPSIRQLILGGSSSHARLLLPLRRPERELVNEPSRRAAPRSRCS